MSLDFAFLAW